MPQRDDDADDRTGGRNAHDRDLREQRAPTEGSGFTLGDGDRIFLRFENFETDNGPDLNVYLRSSADPDDYLDLGDLKGNIGDQNYELPADIDLDRYDLVDIWCVRFGVSFGSAQLARPSGQEDSRQTTDATRSSPASRGGGPAATGRPP
ncbi:MAG: DM13 domain-containing protein [Acidimicrobiales bacterium]